MAARKLGERAGNWSARLTRSLTLESGDKLVTLADARRVVLEHLGSEVEDLELSHAMRLLLAAGLTGRSADRKAATDQVAAALKVRPVQ